MTDERKLMTPKGMFFTKGVGVHKLKLASFELALRQAGIEKFNLVPVSSIFAPHCKIVRRTDALRTYKKNGEKKWNLFPGDVVFAVIARNDTDEQGRMLSAGVGLAQPVDSNRYGYLSEVHEYGMDAKQTAELAEDLAAEMLASTLGLTFDPDKSWNQRKEEWAIAGKIYRPRSVVQFAKGQQKMWTSVVAAAVFIL
jgi:arginine decarboxylase